MIHENPKFVYTIHSLRRNFDAHFYQSHSNYMPAPQSWCLSGPMDSAFATYTWEFYNPVRIPLELLIFTSIKPFLTFKYLRIDHLISVIHGEKCLWLNYKWAKSMPMIQDRTINVLNKCHPHISVKSDLNRDNGNDKMFILILMHWHTFNIMIT